MSFWPYIGLYILSLWLAFELIQERRSPRSTLAWIVALLAVPFIGIPLYYAFGKNRIRGLMRRRAFFDQHAVLPHTDKAGDALRQGELNQKLIALETRLKQCDVDLPKNLHDFSLSFGRFGEIYEPSSAHLSLLIDGVDTFEEIFNSIARAEKYILIQYYILRSDRLGLELQKLLIAKAKSGIAIYLLYDDIGSFNLSRSYVKALKAHGVFVASFLPIHSWKRGLQLNFRNHRKLVVVDGTTAFTGGLNFGEEYISGFSVLGRYRKGKWRDTHLKIDGIETVEKLESVFFDDWHFATGESIDPIIRELRRFDRHEIPPIEPKDAEIIQVIPSAPTDEALVGVLLYMLTIQKAQKRLWIATPYFVPDTPLMRELELCSLRGVDVRLIIPRESDNRLVHWVGATYAKKLKEAGVRVYFYEAGFMHQKVVLVDDDFCLVGTTNFDNRALYLNFETTLAIHGKKFAHKVASMLTIDLAESSTVADPEHGGKVARFLKLQRENLSRLLAPLL